MSFHRRVTVLLTLIAVVAGVFVLPVLAQQNKAKAPAPRTTTPAPARPAPAAPKAESDPARAKILNSDRWKRVMFQMDEWLSAQPFYDKQQIAQIKANQAAAVAKMSADDLEFMLEDMEAKFQILATKDAQDARAWMAHNLSALSEKKRNEVLKRMPNIATMTAAQLRQQIAQIQLKRENLAQEQADYHRLRNDQVNATIAANTAAQQAYIRDQNLQNQAGSYSPYSNQSKQSNELPFANVKPGPDLNFSIGPYGFFQMYYNSGQF